MGYIAFRQSFTGKKIVRIHNVNTETTVGATGIGGKEWNRFPASFLIPEDDPQYDKDGNRARGIYGYMLNSRCWVYDAGLALIAFTISGDHRLCREMLRRLEDEQNEDGSFNFSYDLYIGQLFEGYVRTGAIGWLVHGMCYYQLKTGDKQFSGMIRKAGDWLLSRQITDKDDIRYGLLTGGYGSYNFDDYSYIDERIEWCSTEHNCSALQALGELALLFGGKYRSAAELVKDSIFRTLYDKENARFHQGIHPSGIDNAWALDCCTWAGKVLLSIFEAEMSREIADTVDRVYVTTGKTIVQATDDEHYNTRYASVAVDGVRPYAEGYDDPPDLVWTEGSLGYACLLKALGEHEKADHYINEVIKLQFCQGSTGGIIYTTETRASLPWEFHVWESAVSSAWLYILLKDPNALFPITAKPINPALMSMNFSHMAGAVLKPFKRGKET